MKLKQYFDKIDAILTGKQLPVLNDMEKHNLTGAWKVTCFKWLQEPKATDAQYALDKQLEQDLSNVTFDVLKQTRQYGKTN